MLEKQQRKILKIIYGFDASYATDIERAGIERLNVRRSVLVERFVLKLQRNPHFESWFPLNETPVYSLRNPQKYLELPFRTERLRGAPIYSYRRVLNSLDDE